MIKAVVAGADTPLAGELIRILINHPEVEIIGAHAPEHPGMSAQTIHHGLIGEETVPMTDSLDLNKADVVFFCNTSYYLQYNDIISKYPDMRIIDMVSHNADKLSDMDFVYGLSEIFRKPMVRGAKRAFVPSPISSMALISLYPLAKNLLLNSDINIEISGNEKVTGNDSLVQNSSNDLSSLLPELQMSFSKTVYLKTANPLQRRGMRMVSDIECNLSLDDLEKLYEDAYDDHNFTFIISSGADLKEVEGTDKCLLHLSKPTSSSLKIEAVADATMRGGAGEAVHVMNLLFGLHEKTGLSLKASSF